MLIRERLENFDFSNSEQKIVTYILEKKAAIEEMTTKEIAEATYTSPSTLVRIAHKMNFSGWSDLKEAFLKEEEYLQKHFSEINANLPFQRNDTILSIAVKLLPWKRNPLMTPCRSSLMTTYSRPSRSSESLPIPVFLQSATTC